MVIVTSKTTIEYKLHSSTHTQYCPHQRRGNKVSKKGLLHIIFAILKISITGALSVTIHYQHSFDDSHLSNIFCPLKFHPFIYKKCKYKEKILEN